MLDEIKSYHFVGIGGIGMSGIAEILIRQGYRVSGSDLSHGSLVRHLQHLGARVELGHKESNVAHAEAVVYSSAISPSNPELQAARQRGVPLLHRAEMLAQLLHLREGITVTGTHGKTTTTTIVASILIDADLDPTVVVGARVPSMGGNARLGKGKFFVTEADESDRSFLRFRPTHSIVTNVDRDHMDEYQDLEDLEGAFLEHMRTIPLEGTLVVCSDDPSLRNLIRNVHRPVVTYGLQASAEFSADNISHRRSETCFRVLRGGVPVGETQLNLVGQHNVLNSLGATALGLELGVPFRAISDSLERMTGPERRLERKGKRGGVWVIDDYGHHPAEIKASLEACARFQRRLLLVFQPHRYSRTLHLMEELAQAFGNADRLYVMDIYGAGEEPIEGVNSSHLSRLISQHRQVDYVASSEEMLRILEEETQPGDLVVTMGAGDVWKIGEAFLEAKESD
jgi:UDP-N-acetylmuramate--alanine ligase